MKKQTLALSITVLTLAACSDVGFEAKKTEFIASHSVLTGNSEAEFEVPIPGAPAEGGGTTIPQTGSPNAGGGTTLPTTGSPIGGGVKLPQISWPSSGGSGGTNLPLPGTTTGPRSLPIAGGRIPVVNVCSMVYTGQAGTNVTMSKELNLIVKDPASGSDVCRLSKGVKESILINKTIDVSSCSLPGLEYELELRDPAKPEKNLLFVVTGPDAAMPAHSVTLSRPDKNSAWSMHDMSREFLIEMTGTANGVGVLFADNPKASLYQEVDAKLCDSVTSPLVVNMTAPGERDFGIRLSSPRRGVDFDIRGANAEPMAHAKNRISWPYNDRYMFLALPRNGRVEGIDQLFGDNTRGPDGNFSTDGFASLAKHDDNGDLAIDRNDRVFGDLRLWSDSDRDGLSQPSELFSLDEMGVESIDLRYDPNFFEQDRYGNQLKLKSVVKMRDESLRMIFDVWFAL